MYLPFPVWQKCQKHDLHLPVDFMNNYNNAIIHFIESKFYIFPKIHEKKTNFL